MGIGVLFGLGLILLSTTVVFFGEISRNFLHRILEIHWIPDFLFENFQPYIPVLKDNSIFHDLPIP